MLPPDIYITKSGVEICEWDDNIGNSVLNKLSKFEFEMPTRVRTLMAIKIHMRHLKFIILIQNRNLEVWKSIYGK